jgi:hypothetical protein
LGSSGRPLDSEKNRRSARYLSENLRFFRAFPRLLH